MKSEAGYTLSEILIALAISGMVLISSMSLLISNSNQSAVLMQSLEAESEELRAQTLLQTTLGQAIQLRNWQNNDLNGYVNAAGFGQIREFDSDLEWNTPPYGTHTLAIFLRDARMSTAGVPPTTVASQIFRTGIFFQKPTPRTWGVMYFDQGSGAAVAPTQDDANFGGLTRLRIFNINVFRAEPTTPLFGAPVTSFEVELVFRRWVGDVPANQRLYCPAAFLNTAPCLATGSHKDISRSYKIIVRNNILQASLSGPRGARLYDQIHFFAPLRVELAK